MVSGKTRNRQHAGFTLIEILVVLAIVAILVSMAATGFRVFHADRSPKIQAQRIAALLTLAGDEAILTGTEVGLRVEDQALQFFRFQSQNREWIHLAADGHFRDRQIPEDISVTLQLDGFDVSDNTSGEVDDDAPQVIFFSSGEATPLQMIFSTSDQHESWSLVVDLLGNVQVSEQR